MSEHLEKEKKPIYKKWWFWLIVIIVVIGIAGSGSSDNNSTTQTSSSTTSSNTKVEDENKIYNVGEEAILGKGSVTVTKIEKSKGSSFDKPKAGKEFVIIHVTIKNKGTSNLSYNPYYFKLQNSQGQQENITLSTENNDTALNHGELIENGSVSGTIIFEEPINDSNLTLVYQDNLWSNKSIKIKLQ